ncbi:MAG: MMPL family transporter [Gammaproteobacteria bacterium]|nr:MMPL family transporter [Gammaproteobacteria bacterium]NIN62630.1 MMPL family transporter [Gammaproteobacteria bacterium]NIO63167.1 MMPL family transporter [Gammaproteobacteria bacterium]NIQ11335.1 MMPL family transporter [Gammaproteobacteria bacterium]NIQ20268.1 MMPL family transporter [Gammaproteobacteria bacterium]
MEQQLGKWVLRHRWLIIIVSLLVVLLAAKSAASLHFTSNYRTFFSEENPELLAFDSLENTFTKNDNVIIILEPDNGNVFTRETLAVVEELTEAAWQIPYSNRVDSITNFQYTEAEGDELIVRALVKNAESLNQPELESIRDIAINEPLLVNNLISDDARITAVNITVQLPRIDEATENPEVVKVARQLAAKIEKQHPHIKTYLSGFVLLNNAFTEESKRDVAKLVPVSFTLMLLLIGILIGSFMSTIGTLLVIAFSIVIALGIGAAFGLPITPPTATSPTIILTVAIANCVHILVSFLHAIRQGMERNDALIESLRLNLQPVSLASVTTAIGFSMMVFSDVPPFRHLGLLVASGVLASLVMSITFLPALISFMPIRTRRVRADKPKMMIYLGEFVVKHRSKLLWIMSSVVIVLLLALPRNELNDVFVHYFEEDVQFRADSDFMTENLTGVYTIEYMLDSGESGGISKPGFLADTAKFANWLRDQPEVLHVNTITDILKRLNKNMHADDQSMYKLPKKRDLAAQYLLLYEMSLPYGLDLNNQINVDKSSIRISAKLITLSTNEILDMEQRANNWLEGNAPHIKQGLGTGPTMMFAHIGERNIKSMLLGTTFALILISILLVLAFRSVKIGLLSLIPNLVPAAMGFGLWGIFVGEIGLSLSIVTSMTLGIVIDDTVHFMSKYLRARREIHLSPPDAVRYAFTSVGLALLITSIVLVAGFLVLATSSFELNSGMGLLAAVVISLALVADFLLLPALLMKIEEKSYAEMAVHNTASDSPIP